ncbi:MAG: UDP-3-O-(3-hydroxymyristoyl)glucosamine N-acyltransferase [Candidatus Abyssubacteria bacterium]
MQITLDEIARLVNGTVEGDAKTVITGVAGIKDAGPGDITFLANPKYLPLLSASKASAVIVSHDAPSGGPNLVRTDHPYLAFTRVLKLFAVELPTPKGIHPSSIVGQNVLFGEGVAIHAGSVVEDYCKIGARSLIYAGVCIGSGAEIGQNCVIYPRVVVCNNARIGNGVMIHIGAVVGSQIETARYNGGSSQPVIIEDDVEIGANVTIDAARTGSTTIGKGTKIDNLVHIGSDAVIGRNCIIVSHASVGAGCTIGDGVTIAGQASVFDGMTVGDGAIIAARAGVNHNIEPGQVVSGFPAVDHEKWLRMCASLNRLPLLVREFREFERRMRREEETGDAKTEDR